MKIEFNGKEIIDIDEANQAIEDTKTQIKSQQIKRIEVVTEYPVTEEEDVLYIKVES